MRDLYQVLREKELEITRIRKEIEALRAIIPLLDDNDDTMHGASPMVANLRGASHE
jgi:hypothetical protein